MKKVSSMAVLSTCLVCYIFWLVITGQIVSIFQGAPSAQVLIAGLVVSFLVALFSARFFIHEKPFYLLTKLPTYLTYCFAIFPIELWKANVDVAMRALSPQLPINPGIVKIPSNMKSEYGQAMLANSITLTPGTITMDITEEEGQTYYYIHWIDVKTADPVEAGEAIKGTLESWTGRIWE